MCRYRLQSCLGLYYFSLKVYGAAAAAQSLQSCPTLCDPIDRLPRPWDSPGKNTGVGCHFLPQCMKVEVKLLSVWLLATPWTAAYQAPPSMGFARQEYWSGVPLHSPLRFMFCFKYGEFSAMVLLIISSPTLSLLSSGETSIQHLHQTFSFQVSISFFMILISSYLCAPFWVASSDLSSNSNSLWSFYILVAVVIISGSDIQFFFKSEWFKQYLFSCFSFHF